MLKKRIRNFFIVIAAVVSTTIFYSPASKADDTQLLQQILATLNAFFASFKDFSQAYLTAFNEYAINFGSFAMAWVNPDKSDSTAKIQGSLTNYMNFTWDNNSQQLEMQNSLLQSLFGNDVTTTPSYVNDLNYSILLGGKPYPVGNSSPTPEQLKQSVKNYVTYASSLNIKHQLPAKEGMAGGKLNIEKYENFYKTLTSVQTYNAYLISDFYANYLNGNQLTNLQTDLKDQASSADWFKHVASEANIGIILRQLLMFDSQIYLLFMQLLENEKQLLAAVAMTNSLLVLNNQYYEDILLNKALGVTK